MKFKHEVLQIWQQKQDWSSSKCALYLGISIRSWEKYAHGVAAPPLRIINRIARMLGISAFGLLTPCTAITSGKILKFRNTLLIQWQAEKGLTCKECAHHIGISTSAWNMYCNGQRVPGTLEAINKLGERMEINPLDLLVP